VDKCITLQVTHLPTGIMIVTTLGNTISEAITTFSVTVSIDAIRPLTMLKIGPFQSPSLCHSERSEESRPHFSKQRLFVAPLLKSDNEKTLAQENSVDRRTHSAVSLNISLHVLFM